MKVTAGCFVSGIEMLVLVLPSFGSLWQREKKAAVMSASLILTEPKLKVSDADSMAELPPVAEHVRRLD